MAGTATRTVTAVLLACTACSFKPGAFTGQWDARSDDAELGDGGDPDATAGDAAPSDAAKDALVLPDATLDAAVLPCPTTYTLTNNAEPASRYRYVTASASWTVAEADCEDDGGGAFKPAHLVVLDDSAERDWVFAQGTTNKWVGANDINAEGTLQAVTDQANPYFGTPANSMPNDCMYVSSTATVMDACGGGNQYMCECDGNAANPANY